MSAPLAVRPIPLLVEAARASRSERLGRDFSFGRGFLEWE
jgi:hypothetical protein